MTSNSGQNSTNVKVVDYASLSALLAELTKPERSHLRQVKVEDQGLVEPSNSQGAWVMQPRVRVVATVFDKKNHEILRYQDKWDVGSGVVTIHAPSGRGSSTDHHAKMSVEQITSAVEAEQFTVTKGEWTIEDAEQIYRTE